MNALGVGVPNKLLDQLPLSGDLSTKPKVLVALTGVMRQYLLGHEALQRHLVLPNPEVRFEFGLFTDPAVFCTLRTRSHCRCFERPDNVRTAAQSLYGGRLVAFRSVPAHALVGHHAASAPGALFSIRLADAWNSTLQHIVHEYVHLIVLRFDVELLKPLRVLQMCVIRPGFSIISGSIQRKALFHDRDIDWGYLVCTPKTLKWWLAYWLDADGTSAAASCAGTALALGAKCPPPLPLDDGRVVFTGRWRLDSPIRECTQYKLGCIPASISVPLLLFRHKGVRLGTLDTHGLYANMLRLSSECTNGTLVPRKASTHWLQNVQATMSDRIFLQLNQTSSRRH